MEANYGELDPSKLPMWPDRIKTQRHHSMKNRGLQLDWLNQDSIESLKQASGANFAIAPNSSRRIEPIRLSMPR